MSLIIGVEDDREQKADLGDKIRELCEALLEDENVVAARNRITGFMNDPAATGGYAKLADMSEQLQRKEMAGEGELIIAKQRNGPIGDVPLTFLKEYTRFEDRAEVKAEAT